MNSTQSRTDRCNYSFNFFLGSHSTSMQLNKFSVFALVPIVTICVGEIIVPTPSTDESSLVDDVVKIVTSCYGDRIDGIGLGGNLPNALSMKLSKEHFIPVALISNITNDEAKKTFNFSVPTELRHKLQIFIVDASSWDQLARTILLNIKDTIWWNHMASFFILDRSPECDNAADYLYLAWQINILNVKSMCYYQKSGRTIFNYNPFESQVPPHWQRVDIMSAASKHPFTYYSREYRGDESICADLDFNKAKDPAR